MKSHSPTISPFARLMQILKPEAKDIWSLVLISGMIGILSLSIPIAGQQLVRAVSFGTLYQPIVVLTLVILVILSFVGSLQILQMGAVEFLQRRLFARLAGELAYRLPRVDAGHWRSEFGPDAVNRFFDILTVQKSLSSLLVDGISVLLNTVIGITIMSIYHPYLLGYGLILILLLAGVVFILGRHGVSTAIEESYAKYRTAAWLQDLSYDYYAYRTDQSRLMAMLGVDSSCRQYLIARTRHFRILRRQMIAIVGIQALASTSLLGLGGYLVLNEQLTLGQLVAAELIVAMVVSSFSKMGKHLESWFDLMSAVDKIGHLLDLPLESDDGTSGREPPKEALLEVVGFPFSVTDDSSRPDGSAKSELSFLLEPGESIAIMGPPCSGKSYLLDMLYRLADAPQGYALLDRRDLRDFDLSVLRNSIVMLRELEFFPGSILENVKFGNASVQSDDAVDVLKRMSLLDEIRRLPNSHNTELSTDGNPLTHSQLIRLVLSRAMAGRPKILMIDGLLDSLSEELIQRVLPEILPKSKETSVLIVTGNPQVARACSRIVRLGVLSVGNTNTDH